LRKNRVKKAPVHSFLFSIFLDHNKGGKKGHLTGYLLLECLRPDGNREEEKKRVRGKDCRAIIFPSSLLPGGKRERKKGGKGTANLQ